MADEGYDPLYLQGIEEFNRGCYFESHEVWEALWKRETGPRRRFYQGLIQAAVALHHLGRGNRRGARALMARARQSLDAYRPRCLGLDVDGFLADLARRLAETEAESDRGAQPGPGGLPAHAPTIALCPPPTRPDCGHPPDVVH